MRRSLDCKTVKLRRQREVVAWGKSLLLATSTIRSILSIFMATQASVRAVLHVHKLVLSKLSSEDCPPPPVFSLGITT